MVHFVSSYLVVFSRGIRHHAYTSEVLSSRFERVNVNCGQTKRSHSYTSVDSNGNTSPVEKIFEDVMSLNDESEDEFDVVQPVSEKELGEVSLQAFFRRYPIWVGEEIWLDSSSI